MVGSIEQPTDEGAEKEETRHQQHRIRGRPSPAGCDEEGYREDVLQDEHAYRQATGQRPRLVGPLQSFHCKDGAREGEGEPDYEGLTGIEIPQQRHTKHADPEQQSTDEHGSGGRDHRGGNPNRRPDQSAQTQLEADPEEEQQNPHFGDQVDCLGCGVPERVEHKAGHQIPHQRRKSTQPGEQAKPKGRDEKRYLHMNSDYCRADRGTYRFRLREKAASCIREGYSAYSLVKGRRKLRAIGGASATGEVTVPGFRHDLGAAVHPLGAASPLFRSLSLDRYGLEWLRPEIPLAHPLDGGLAVTLHHSITGTADRLGADGPLYRQVVGGLARRWDVIESAVFGPVFRIPDHPLALAGLGLRGLLPAATAAKRLHTEEGRALLAGLAAHTPMPLDKSGNTAVALVLAALAHVTGWPVARGGSQSIVHALAAVVDDLGGSIETDHTIDNLDTIPPTETVLLNTGPRAAAAIAGDRMPARIRRAFRRYPHGPGSFKVDFALEGPVPWTADECRRAGTVHVGGTFEEIADAERQVWNGVSPDRPFVIAAQPSVIDPDRAPDGKHVLWVYCHGPVGSRWT